MLVEGVDGSTGTGAGIGSGGKDPVSLYDIIQSGVSAVGGSM